MSVSFVDWNSSLPEMECDMTTFHQQLKDHSALDMKKHFLFESMTPAVGLDLLLFISLLRPRRQLLRRHGPVMAAGRVAPDASFLDALRRSPTPKVPKRFRPASAGRPRVAPRSRGTSRAAWRRERQRCDAQREHGRTIGRSFPNSRKLAPLCKQHQSEH